MALQGSKCNPCIGDRGIRPREGKLLEHWGDILWLSDDGEHGESQGLLKHTFEVEEGAWAGESVNITIVQRLRRYMTSNLNCIKIWIKWNNKLFFIFNHINFHQCN